ncbi:MipA/OmpV family protein [Thalassotalea ganghwensis]
MKKRNKIRLTLASALLLSFTSSAQTEKQNFVIFGPALTPEYQGSDDYSTVPMMVADLSIGNYDLEIEGLTLRTSLFESNNLQLGITSELDFGRDADVENSTIAKFEDIDLSVNVGAFVNHQLSNLYLNGDEFNTRLSIFTDGSNSHKGSYSTLEFSYTLPLMIPWRIEFELSTTYADSNYMNTYFGVNQMDSALSGLPMYSASSSIRDITFNANIGLFMSPKWGAFLRTGATQLMQDAKDSPIVALGDDKQYFIGLGVFYRFGE